MVLAVERGGKGACACLEVMRAAPDPAGAAAATD
jgi:hypothetical protein